MFGTFFSLHYGSLLLLLWPTWTKHVSDPSFSVVRYKTRKLKPQNCMDIRIKLRKVCRFSISAKENKTIRNCSSWVYYVLDLQKSHFFISEGVLCCWTKNTIAYKIQLCISDIFEVNPTFQNVGVSNSCATDFFRKKKTGRLWLLENLTW